MYKDYLWPSVRWGLMAVAVHWMLSVPFLFLGPMLATPSHGGIIGWMWLVLEFPAFVIYVTIGLDRVGIFGASIMGEFVNFIMWGTAFWLIIGFGVSLSVRLILAWRSRK